MSSEPYDGVLRAILEATNMVPQKRKRGVEEQSTSADENVEDTKRQHREEDDMQLTEEVNAASDSFWQDHWRADPNLTNEQAGNILVQLIQAKLQDPDSDDEEAEEDVPRGSNQSPELRKENSELERGEDTQLLAQEESDTDMGMQLSLKSDSEPEGDEANVAGLLNESVVKQHLLNKALFAELKEKKGRNEVEIHDKDGKIRIKQVVKLSAPAEKLKAITDKYITHHENEFVTKQASDSDQMVFHYKFTYENKYGQKLKFHQIDEIPEFKPDAAQELDVNGTVLKYTIPDTSLSSYYKDGLWKWDENTQLFTRPDKAFRPVLIQRTFEAGTNRYLGCQVYDVGKYLAFDMNTQDKRRVHYGRFFSVYQKKNNTKGPQVRRPQWTDLELQILYSTINKFVGQCNEGILMFSTIDWNEVADYINQMRRALRCEGGARTPAACASLWNKTSSIRDPVLHDYKIRWETCKTWKQNGKNPRDLPAGGLKQGIIFKAKAKLKRLLDQEGTATGGDPDTGTEEEEASESLEV